MPLKTLSLICFSCSITVFSWAESDSNASSYAALQMRLLLFDQQNAEERPVATADIEMNEIQSCDNKVEKVRSLLVFIPSADKAHTPEAQHALNELLLLSRSSVFDQECNDWLHDILAHFNTVKLKHEGYKQYLYSVLASDENNEVGTLAVAALQYSLLYGALTAKEWQHLKTALRYSSHQELKQVIDLLSQATIANTQSAVMFKQQADELLELATVGKLGVPLRIKPSFVIGLLLANVQRNFPDQFMLMYRQYHDGIDKPARLEQYIRNYISASPSPERLQLLALYLADIYSSDVKLNKRDANKLFTMLQRLRSLKEVDLELLESWQSIIADNERIILDIVHHSSAKTSEKEYWLNFYAQKQAKATQHSL